MPRCLLALTLLCVSCAVQGGSPRFFVNAERIELTARVSCPLLYAPYWVVIDQPSDRLRLAYVSVNASVDEDIAQAVRELLQATELAASELGNSTVPDLLFAQWLSISNVRTIGKHSVPDILAKMVTDYHAEPAIAMRLRILLTLASVYPGGQYTPAIWTLNRNRGLKAPVRELVARMEQEEAALGMAARGELWLRLADLLLMAGEPAEARTTYVAARMTLSSLADETLAALERPALMCRPPQLSRAFVDGIGRDTPQSDFGFLTDVDRRGRPRRLRITDNPLGAQGGRAAISAARSALFRPALDERGKPVKFRDHAFRAVLFEARP